MEMHPYIEHYLDAQQGKAEETVKARRSDLKDFQKWLNSEGYGVEEVDSGKLHQYFSGLQAENYAPATIGGRWESVRQLYEHLQLEDEIEEDEIEEHPMDDLKRSRYLDSKERGHVESEEIQYLSKEEVEQLVANVTPPKLRNRLLIRLLFQTGMRANEVTRVRLRDIDRDEHSIKAYSKKTGDTRTVYYQESLDFLLDEWLDGGYRDSFQYAKDSEYLFVTRRDGKMRDEQVNEVVRKAADRAGIQEVIYTDKNGNPRHRVTGHILRHSHAVYSLKCGIDLRRLQIHMGHESLKMTEEYLKVLDDDVRDAYRDNWGRA